MEKVRSQKNKEKEEGISSPENEEIFPVLEPALPPHLQRHLDTIEEIFLSKFARLENCRRAIGTIHKEFSAAINNLKKENGRLVIKVDQQQVENEKLYERVVQLEREKEMLCAQFCQHQKEDEKYFGKIAGHQREIEMTRTKLQDFSSMSSDLQGRVLQSSEKCGQLIDHLQKDNREIWAKLEDLTSLKSSLDTSILVQKEQMEDFNREMKELHEKIEVLTTKSQLKIELPVGQNVAGSSVERPQGDHSLAHPEIPRTVSPLPRSLSQELSPSPPPAAPQEATCAEEIPLGNKSRFLTGEAAKRLVAEMARQRLEEERKAKAAGHPVDNKPQTGSQTLPPPLSSPPGDVTSTAQPTDHGNHSLSSQTLPDLLNEKLRNCLAKEAKLQEEIKARTERENLASLAGDYKKAGKEKTLRKKAEKTLADFQKQRHQYEQRRLVKRRKREQQMLEEREKEKQKYLEMERKRLAKEEKEREKAEKQKEKEKQKYLEMEKERLAKEEKEKEKAEKKKEKEKQKCLEMERRRLAKEEKKLSQAKKPKRENLFLRWVRGNKRQGMVVPEPSACPQAETTSLDGEEEREGNTEEDMFMFASVSD